MDIILPNVLGWPCVLCWLIMWAMILTAGSKKRLRTILLQPSVVIAFSISIFTILPGYVLANTNARLFRFEPNESDYLQLGNFYGLAFLMIGLSHLAFRFSYQHRGTLIQQKSLKSNNYLIPITLFFSLLISFYYVHQVGILALQARDHSNMAEVSGGGLYAFFRFLPYSCLTVISFLRSKGFPYPVWIFYLNIFICLLYGVVFVERLLFVFTVLIIGYFFASSAKRGFFLRLSLIVSSFILLFSAISFYRFLYDKDYNLSKKNNFSGESVWEQIGINLVFFDNISPVADAYDDLNKNNNFWGSNSYAYSLLQFVPGFIWTDKKYYTDNERVVQKLGVTVGSTGSSITPSPWGEFLLCYGGTYFILFVAFLSIFMRYLDKIHFGMEKKSYVKQFAFSCFILNLIFNTRNSASSFFLFSAIFWLPSHIIFCLTCRLRLGRQLR